MSGAETQHRSLGMYLYIGRGALHTWRSSTGRSCGGYGRENAGMSSEREENAGMSSEREVGILSAEYPRFPG